eukprot:scaffold22512_cov18-Tisochrysis_lutea.AAC.1
MAHVSKGSWHALIHWQANRFTCNTWCTSSGGSMSISTAPHMTCRNQGAPHDRGHLQVERWVKGDEEG